MNTIDKIPAYLRLHSNYDCWMRTSELRSRGTALCGIMAALSLNPWKVKQAANRRGVSVSGPWPNLQSRNDKELVDYNEFIECLLNRPCYGNWCFFGMYPSVRTDDGLKKIPDDGFFESLVKSNAVAIPKGTVCGMFDWWNGSGSLSFCKTLHDVSVQELRWRIKPYHDGMRIVPDGAHNHLGYTPHEVYHGYLSEELFLVPA